MPNDFKVNNKDTSTTSNAAAAGWVSLLLTLKTSSKQRCFQIKLLTGYYFSEIK